MDPDQFSVKPDGVMALATTPVGVVGAVVSVAGAGAVVNHRSADAMFVGCVVPPTQKTKFAPSGRASAPVVTKTTPCAACSPATTTSPVCPFRLVTTAVGAEAGGVIAVPDVISARSTEVWPVGNWKSRDGRLIF